MSRRIVWQQYQSGGENKSIDGYFDRLLKYIPADVVGLWLAGNGLIQSQGNDIPKPLFLWMLFGAGLVFSYFWTRKQTAESGKPTAWQQIWLSCASFAVWVFAIGGPFETLDFYQPFYGSFLLLIYASAIPLLPPLER
ncbi:MAG: hypothetical protein ACFB4I_00505 [Cyanophyceae cyanobacterium]